MFTGVGIGLLINYFRKWGDCGAGWILLFIGVAFLIVWLVERRDKNNVQPPKP
jgi:putative Mn2+ efflux pump MntP